jgi:hypothetical protein
MDSLASNPLFLSYAKCVTILSLKMSFIAWTTVCHMVITGGMCAFINERILESSGGCFRYKDAHIRVLSSLSLYTYIQLLLLHISSST